MQHLTAHPAVRPGLRDKEPAELCISSRIPPPCRGRSPREYEVSDQTKLSVVSPCCRQRSQCWVEQRAGRWHSSGVSQPSKHTQYSTWRMLHISSPSRGERWSFPTDWRESCLPGRRSPRLRWSHGLPCLQGTGRIRSGQYGGREVCRWPVHCHTELQSCENVCQCGTELKAAARWRQCSGVSWADRLCITWLSVQLYSDMAAACCLSRRYICVNWLTVFRYNGRRWDAVQSPRLEDLPGGQPHAGAAAGPEDVEQPRSEGESGHRETRCRGHVRTPGSATRSGGLTDGCRTWRTDPCWWGDSSPGECSLASVSRSLLPVRYIVLFFRSHAVFNIAGIHHYLESQHSHADSHHWNSAVNVIIWWSL